jgi:hypothetical protein
MWKWNIKFYVLVSGDSLSTDALRHMKLGTVNDHWPAYKFHLNLYFV